MWSDSQPHRPIFLEARTDLWWLCMEPALCPLIRLLIAQAPCVAFHLHTQHRALQPPELVEQRENDIKEYDMCRVRVEAYLPPSLQNV